MPGTRSRTPKVWRRECKTVNKTFRLAALCALAIAPSVAASAQSIDAPASAAQAETFEALALRCAPSVHVRTLSAVVLQESRGNRLAIGINRAPQLPRQPRNEAEAIATARWLLANGYNFDAGLGQINSNNFAALGLDPSTLFNSCENLRGAATVLTACYSKAARELGTGQAGIHGALSCYNTGNMTRGFRNGYVSKVVGQVALPVPALAPDPAPGPVPRIKRAMPGEMETPAPVEQAAQRVRSTGMGDAFSRGGRDAFAPQRSPEPAMPSMGDDTDPRGPVILTATKGDS